MKRQVYLPIVAAGLLSLFGGSYTAKAQCSTPSSGQTITSLTCSSGTAKWAPVSGAMGYEHYMTTSMGTPPGSMTSGTMVMADSASFSSLNASTIYYVYVRTVCMSGKSAWSSPITLATPACSMPAPSFTTTAAPRSITLNWPAVSGALGYEYVVNTTASDPTTAGTSLGLVTTVTVNNLNPATNYYVHMRTSYNGSGGVAYSPWSAAKAVSTPKATSVGNTQGNEKVFTAYPNPGNGIVTVEVPSDKAIVKLLSIDGKVIRSFQLQKGTQVIDLTSLNAGLYLLRYVDGDAMQTLKLSKF